MNNASSIDLSTITIAGVGGSENTNWRQCWQAHDDYYACIDNQIENGASEINKFKCMNSLYMYEMVCPTNFIKFRKHNYRRILSDRHLWTADQLELINFKRNGWRLDNPLPNNANFEDPKLNSLLFKHF